MSDMEKEAAKGKRAWFNFRIRYSPKARAKFYYGTHVFDVVEIRENELCLTSANKLDLDKSIKGILTFLNGESVNIEGSIIWKKDNDCGLKFENVESSDALANEIRHIMELQSTFDWSKNGKISRKK